MKLLTIFIIPLLLVTACSNKIDIYRSATTQKQTGITLKWSYVTSLGSPVYSTPIRGRASNGSAQQDAIIIGAWDQFLYTLNYQTGQLIWKTDQGGENYGRAQSADVTGDGNHEIFVGSHGGTIRSLSYDGQVRWEHQNLFERQSTGIVDRTGVDGSNDYLEDDSLSLPKNTYLDFGGTSTSAQIEIMAGTGSGQIRELVAVSGNRITISGNWTTPLDSTSKFKIWYRYSSDLYYQHAGTLNQESGTYYLYVTGFDNQVVKLNADTGAIIWEYSTLGDIEPFPYVGDIDNDGKDEVITVSLDHIVHCLDAQTGNIKWQRTLVDGNDAFITVGDINSDSLPEVLISSRDNTLYALSSKNGSIIFQTLDMGGDIDSAPLLVGSQIAVAGDSGRIYLFDNTGSVLWNTQLGTATINSSPRLLNINSKQFILVADMDGFIYFIDPQSGSIIKTMTFPAGIEGTILLDDIDNNGAIEMTLTTLDGTIYQYEIFSIIAD